MHRLPKKVCSNGRLLAAVMTMMMMMKRTVGQGHEGSPVHLSVVSAQLLPQDSVSWRGQKAARPLSTSSQFYFLNLNGHLFKQSKLFFSPCMQWIPGQITKHF